MIPWLAASGAFLFGLIVGWVIWRQPNVREPFPKPLPAPLPDDEYRQRSERSREAYRQSMEKYDKLVPWASGGAMVLSITFLNSLAGRAHPSTSWLLGCAWASLIASFLSSFASQYTSSRIHSWRGAFLQALQEPPVQAATNDDRLVWEKEVRRYECLVQRNGMFTQCLNVGAGALLTLGLAFLAVFAYLNAPFGKAPWETVGDL
jgi:hypothetical protein